MLLFPCPANDETRLLLRPVETAPGVPDDAVDRLEVGAERLRAGSLSVVRSTRFFDVDATCLIPKKPQIPITQIGTSTRGLVCKKICFFFNFILGYLARWV